MVREQPRTWSVRLEHSLGAATNICVRSSIDFLGLNPNHVHGSNHVREISNIHRMMFEISRIMFVASRTTFGKSRTWFGAFPNATEHGSGSAELSDAGGVLTRYVRTSLRHLRATGAPNEVRSVGGIRRECRRSGSAKRGTGVSWECLTSARRVLATYHFEKFGDRSIRGCSGIHDQGSGVPDQGSGNP